MTKHSRPALRYFTDRRDPILHFLRMVQENAPEGLGLYYWGEGGCGKSLLLRFLRDHCCISLQQQAWEYISTRPSDDLLDYFRTLRERRKAELSDFPMSFVDFETQAVRAEPLDLLMSVRRNLAGQRLRFPSFDFACLWYLHQTRRLSPELVSRLFPLEEADFVSALVDAISSTGWAALGKAVIGLIDRHFKENLLLYRSQRGIDGRLLRDLIEMEAEGELYEELPVLLARDLNASLALPGAPKRVVMFFDTHDALRGPAAAYGDRWLRAFLTTLEPGLGLVAVVSGREAPGWADDAEMPVPPDRLRNMHLESFTHADARAYLDALHIRDPELQTDLLSWARTSGTRVHPLYLGLCADLVREAQGDRPSVGRAPRLDRQRRILIKRFLEYADDETAHGVRALAACRGFDRKVFHHLGGRLSFQHTAAVFRRLTAYSFVWESEERKGWYTIHALLRRVLHEQHDEMLLDAHREMEALYAADRDRDPAALVEWLHHLTFTDPGRAPEVWLHRFAGALGAGRYDVCRLLLGIEFPRSDDPLLLGSAALARGDFQVRVASYAEAEAEYREADRLFATPGVDADSAAVYRALAALSLGRLKQALKRHDEACGHFRRAGALLEPVLARDPDEVEALKPKAHALRLMGESLTARSDLDGAIRVHRQALRTYKRAVRLAPDDMDLLRRYAAALLGVAQVQVATHGLDEALRNLQDAVRMFDGALSRQPRAYLAHSGQGQAYLEMAKIHLGRREQRAALDCFDLAVLAFESALDHAPHDVEVANRLGAALTEHGAALLMDGRRDEAVVELGSAVGRLDAAIQTAPAHVDLVLHRGVALLRLSEAHAERAESREADARVRDAQEALRRVLLRVPEYPQASHWLGRTLAHWARLTHDAGDAAAAAERYRAALAAYDECLRHAPKFVTAMHGRALCLLSLADFLAADEAEAALGRALESLDAALELIPDFGHAHAGRGRALSRRGELHEGRGDSEAARGWYRSALEAYQKAKKLDRGDSRHDAGIAHCAGRLDALPEETGLSPSQP